jgi:hypothetical protein
MSPRSFSVPPPDFPRRLVPAPPQVRLSEPEQQNHKVRCLHERNWNDHNRVVGSNEKTKTAGASGRTDSNGTAPSESVLNNANGNLPRSSNQQPPVKKIGGFQVTGDNANGSTVGVGPTVGSNKEGGSVFGASTDRANFGFSSSTSTFPKIRFKSSMRASSVFSPRVPTDRSVRASSVFGPIPTFGTNTSFSSPATATPSLFRVDPSAPSTPVPRASFAVGASPFIFGASAMEETGSVSQTTSSPVVKEEERDNSLFPTIWSCLQDHDNGYSSFMIRMPPEEKGPFRNTEIVPTISSFSRPAGQGKATMTVSVETYWKPTEDEATMLKEIKCTSRALARLKLLATEWTKPDAKVPVGQVRRVTKEAIRCIIEHYIPVHLAYFIAPKGAVVDPDWLAGKEKKGKLTTLQIGKCLRWITGNSSLEPHQGGGRDQDPLRCQGREGNAEAFAPFVCQRCGYSRGAGKALGGAHRLLF